MTHAVQLRALHHRTSAVHAYHRNRFAGLVCPLTDVGGNCAAKIPPTPQCVAYAESCQLTYLS
ncbi:hypothetical protein J6590_026838 [Homalodisca vitripennis]|nr:hypothetical protein J6590_026838 [Homalodisca vitripennis]